MSCIPLANTDRIIAFVLSHLSPANLVPRSLATRLISCTSSKRKSVCGSYGWGKICLVRICCKKVFQPLENLFKACHCLFTAEFAQSTLTNAMNLIYFNAVRELADVSPFRVISERNKYAVTAHITQWKGDQFLMV